MPSKLDVDALPDRLPRAGYTVDVMWRYLEEHIRSQQDRARTREMGILNLEPDFQRAHVWTDAQRVAYVEYVLLGGEASPTLIFNCVGWGRDYRGPYVIVDGKQRLESVRRFMRDEFRIFAGRQGRPEGWLASEIQIPSLVGFKWQVHNLATQEDVLKLYLALNRGGTPHSDSEIARVEDMLKGKP